MRAVFMAPRLCLMNGEIEIASELAISYDTIRDRVGKRAINWIRRRSRKVKRMEIWLDENWLGFTYFGSVKSEMRRATRRSFIVIHTKELRLMRYIKSENELWASLFGVLNQLTRSFTLAAEWDEKWFFFIFLKKQKRKDRPKTRKSVQLNDMLGKMKEKRSLFCVLMMNEIKSRAGCIWIKMLGRTRRVIRVSYTKTISLSIHCMQAEHMPLRWLSYSTAAQREGARSKSWKKDQLEQCAKNEQMKWVAMTIMDNHTKLWVSMSTCSEKERKNFRLQCKWPRSCYKEREKLVREMATKLRCSEYYMRAMQSKNAVETRSAACRGQGDTLFFIFFLHTSRQPELSRKKVKSGVMNMYNAMRRRGKWPWKYGMTDFPFHRSKNHQMCTVQTVCFSDLKWIFYSSTTVSSS